MKRPPTLSSRAKEHDASFASCSAVEGRCVSADELAHPFESTLLKRLPHPVRVHGGRACPEQATGPSRAHSARPSMSSRAKSRDIPLDSPVSWPGSSGALAKKARPLSDRRHHDRSRSSGAGRDLTRLNMQRDVRNIPKFFGGWPILLRPVFLPFSNYGSPVLAIFARAGTMVLPLGDFRKPGTRNVPQFLPCGFVSKIRAGSAGPLRARQLAIQARLWLERGPFPLLLPHPLLPFHHDSSQDPVHPRLVARAFGLEPVHHFHIHAQRDSPLARPVPARFRPLLLRQQ